MRSLARDFSSSRRAPPKAASKPYLSSAWRRPTVFMMWVCVLEPWEKGPTPSRTPSSLMWTMRSKPSRRRHLVAKRDHLAELPGRVDMQEGKWRLGRIEGLHRQMHEHGGILAHRIEHHRLGEARGHLTEDVDRFGFEPIKMGEFREHGDALREKAKHAGARQKATGALSDRTLRRSLAQPTCDSRRRRPFADRSGASESRSPGDSRKSFRND